MNYYAVKALQARVYLWRGKNEDIVNALSAANEIITALEIILQSMKCILIAIS